MLKNMLKIAEKRNDVMSRFYNALLLGDVPERVRVLEETGQRNTFLFFLSLSVFKNSQINLIYFEVQLAYLTAKAHGLEEDAERLLDKIHRLQQKKKPIVRSFHLHVSNTSFLE
jgi:coatomer protein complex subunit alpha (xenin)